MTEFTPAGMLAWKIAATEAGAGGHPLILPVHLVIGVLSLEKVRPAFAEAAGVAESDLDSVRVERATLAEMLAGLRAQPATLRRAMREAAGRGPGAKPGPVSRDAGSRAAFARAETLAAPGPSTTLHLLAALATEPDATVAAGFAACGLDAARVAARAGAFAGVTLRSGATPMARGPPGRRGGQARGGPRRCGPGPCCHPSAGGRGHTDARPLRPRSHRARSQGLSCPPPSAAGASCWRSCRRWPAAPSRTRCWSASPVSARPRSSRRWPCARPRARTQPVLGGRRIVELNLGALLGRRSSDRGELEERVRRILAEARAHPELLLFVDEVHTLVGAGLGRERTRTSRAWSSRLCRAESCA